MKILITGSTGQLGLSFKELYRDKEAIDFVDRSSFDLADVNNMSSFLKDRSYNYIINCAAYTQVDKAEDEPDKAFAVNAKGATFLANWCAENNCVLIHISTDYVFNGNNHKPYLEEDDAHTLGAYGLSKVRGEELIFSTNANAFIIRTSWLYSEFGKNFFKTMIELGSEKEEIRVVADQVGSPTWAFDLSQAINRMILSGKIPNGTEIYHYANEGICSWYDFAKEIMKQAGLNCQVLPIETKDYPTPAKRPSYSVLNKSKIKRNFDLVIPHWTESLHHCLEAYNKLELGK